MTHNQNISVSEAGKFLAMVKSVIDRSNTSKEESRKRGEQFNMFLACGVNHYENTHSNILAELLNPQGNHGQSDLFLKEFLKVVEDKVSELDLDTSKSEVIREKDTGNGRIDILIQSSQKAVIIENKIYADDQWQQLIRYNEYAKKHFSKGYVILYLTLEGVEANENSGKDIEYITISYKEDILNWINRCAILCLKMPLIRETLIQYANLIKQLTNQDMETKYKNELLELMAENPETVDAVCNLRDDFIRYAWEKSKIQLEEIAKNKGFLFKEGNVFEKENDRCIFALKNSDWKSVSLCFGAGSRSEIPCNFYWGLCSMKGELTPQFKLECFGCKENVYWPYGNDWLDPYRNWDVRTAADMINGKFAKYIETRIDGLLIELKDRNITDL